MERHIVHGLICWRYEEVHGAVPEIAYGRFIGAGGAAATKAALGYRRAEAQAMFLETYLDRPIEAELSEIFGRPIPRRNIVEIGNLASDNLLNGHGDSFGLGNPFSLRSGNQYTPLRPKTMTFSLRTGW